MSINETLVHCGACGEEGIDGNHTCIEKTYLLPLVNKSIFRLPQHPSLSHELARFIDNIQDARELINEYAKCIANEMPNKYRIEIHDRLCEHLELDRKDFKPFESDLIVTLPTYEVCKQIIYQNILEIGMRL